MAVLMVLSPSQNLTSLPIRRDLRVLTVPPVIVVSQEVNRIGGALISIYPCDGQHQVVDQDFDRRDVRDW
jgi:hypothetical protein